MGQAVPVRTYDVLDGSNNVVEMRDYEDWNNNAAHDTEEKSWVHDTLDSDGDGLVNAREMVWGTDPNNPDSDYDGITDGNEVDLLGGPNAGFDPIKWDTNDNGYSDHDEVYNCYAVNYTALGSGVSYYDWDGDGYRNPNDSHPLDSSLYTDFNNDGFNDDSQLDDDGDGIANQYDSHPSNPNLQDDWDNNGYNDSGDADHDSWPDVNDSHPLNPGLWCDWNDNGVNDDSEAVPLDRDGDGFYDNEDSHYENPNLWNDWNYNGYNDDIEGTDQDSDGWPLYLDSHPQDALLWSDRDDDGLNEEDEILLGTNPDTYDTDNDGLSDGQEVAYNTNPLAIDSDQDGLTDYDELVIYADLFINGKHLNPNDAHSFSPVYLDHLMVFTTDTDEDGIPDAVENFYAPAMNPNDGADALGDLDGDYTNNLQEYLNGTRLDGNLTLYDYDRDGITDIEEDWWSSLYPGILNKYVFEDSVQDPDGDGILNFEEVHFALDPGNPTTHGTTEDLVWKNTNHGGTWATAIAAGDMDGDGLPDVWEHRHFLDLRDAGNVAADPDCDGLTNGQEYWSKRNPRIHDYEPPAPASGAFNTPPVWGGSQWTQNPLILSGTILPPVPLDQGNVKEFSLFEYKAPAAAITPYLERRKAEYSGVVHWYGDASFVLNNGREEGSTHPDFPEGPANYFNYEPVISDNNLSNTWINHHYSDDVAHVYTFYDGIGGYSRNASWSKMRLTMPPGSAASHKIIQEYYRSDEFDVSGASAPRYVFTINATSKSNEITFEPHSANINVKLRNAPHEKTRMLSPSDAAGPKYRKIGLNGVPAPDSPPQDQEENDIPADETYVDAYTRTVRHSVTDIWSRSGGAGIPLTLRRTNTPETWSWVGGLRPHERPDRPFGTGFSSNLTPSITFVHPPEESNQPYRATVVDENGSSRSFVMVGYFGLAGKWVPALDEKQDAKTCYDKLVKVTGGWELHKKYGTVCRYEMIFEGDPLGYPGNFGGNVSQIISVDRVDGSEKWSGYEYGRMVEVEDRLGNQLVYIYPDGKDTLIPKMIYDPDRPSQKLLIEQNNQGRVVAVSGPSGEIVHYEYEDLEVEAVSEEFDVQVLSQVRRGSGGDAVVVKYGHSYDEQQELDPDPTTRNPGLFGSIDLTSIEDERGNTHAFSYERVSQTAYEYSNGYSLEQPWMKRQSGTPKLVKTITRPNNRVVTFSGDRSLEYLLNGEVVTEGIVTTVSSPSTGTYTYSFTQPHIFCPVPLNADSEHSVIVSFTKMNITSTAGTEHYEFDPNAGMALKQVEDVSGNVTSYTYDDTIMSPNSGLVSYGLLKFDDPTTEKNAMHGQLDAAGQLINGLKHYSYESNFRILASVTDELGTLTEYEIDPQTGLRTQEKITDANASVLRVTNFDYDDPVFAGFMTRRTVKTTGMGALPSGIAAPIGEMRTEYVSDINGHIQKQVVYAGDVDNPATLDVDESLPLVTSYTYTGGGSKSTVTDPRNHTTRFEYYVNTLRLKKVIYPDDTLKEWEYDDHGNMVTETDEAGVRTIHVYDGLNRRILSAVDLNGNGMVDSRYTSLTPGNENSLPVYDGDLVSEVSYNDFNLPIYETDARGIRTFYEYDGVGRRIRATVNCDDSVQDRRLVTRYVDDDAMTPDWVGGSVFDAVGFKPLRTQDPRGFVTRHEYDRLYRSTKTELTDTTYNPPQVVTVETRYDAVGNVLESEDALGRITSTEYDGLRRATRVVLPSSPGGGSEFAVPVAEKVMKYTPSGQVWSSTDELNNTTLIFYDCAGRPTVTMLPPVLTPSGGNQFIRPQTWLAYDASGNVIAKSDALGNVTDTEYDARNRAVKTILPEVHDAMTGNLARPQLETEYDACGRVIVSKDPMNQSTLTRYDRAGRVYAVISPPVGAQTHVTTSTHDAAGQVLTVTNAENQTITNTYDALGRLIISQDHAGIVNQFGYDKTGNRVKVRDGLDQETLFVYDAQNRLQRQSFGNSDVWTFGYNELNKISQRDAKGVTTSYVYDVRNRLRIVTAPDLERTSVYDDGGRLLGVTEAGRPQAAVCYVYDALGRVGAEISQTVLHTYGYDLGGNRVQASYGTGREVSTGYDALNRPATLTEAGRTTTYGYDLAGRALVLVAGNGQVTENGYDELGRLTNRTLFASEADLTDTGVLAEFGWGHDAIGNVTAQAEQWKANASRPAGLRTITTTYDGANRLQVETISDPTNGLTMTIYGYDAANNRKSKTVTGSGESGYWEYDYNEVNQLKAWRRYDELGGTLQKTADLGYDANGNRTVLDEADHTVLGTYARLVNQGITYQAVAAGSSGDDLNITLERGEALAARLENSHDIVVTLEEGEPTSDSLQNQGITYTTVQPHQTGQAVSVSLVADEADQQAEVLVDGNSVTALLATDSGGKASATEQGIVYEAVHAGTAGNAVSVRLEPGEGDELLNATRQGNEIIVKLANQNAERAALELMGMLYEAVEPGDEGNDVTVTHQFPDGPGQALSVSVDGRDIKVALASDMGDYASLSVHNGMVLKALNPGPEGNQIFLYTVGGNTPGHGLEAFVDGDDVTTIIYIRCATDGSGNCTSTVSDYAAAIQSVASHLVTVDAGPNGSTLIDTGHAMYLAGGGANFVAYNTNAEVAGAISQNADAYALVHATPLSINVMAGSGTLSGGSNAVFSNTREEVAELLADDEDVAALITVMGGDAALIQPATVQLTGGGRDFQVLTKADDLVTLFSDEEGPAYGLVTVSGAGTTILQALPQTLLTGGEAPILTTAAAVASLLNAHPALSLLLSAVGAGGHTLAPLERTHLSRATTTGTTYAWDAQDRLKGVTMPDGTQHGYTYDYRTRRVETTRSGGSEPSQITDIVFAGGLSLAEYQRSGSAPLVAGSPTVHYVRGPDMGGGVGGMLYSIRNGNTLRYSLNNGRGDIVAQSDENATLTWTASYEAYGKRPVETGSNADKQRANSKDEDPTGLLNEGFRYRDLETGVWLSRDPAGFVDGPNLYAYVMQNPWTSFDPDGLAKSNTGMGPENFGGGGGTMSVNSLPLGGRINIPGATRPMSGTARPAAGPSRPAANSNSPKSGNTSTSKPASSTSTPKTAKETLKNNQKMGAEHESKVETKLNMEQTDVKKQVTLQTESGTRTRIDFAGKKETETVLTEAKGSPTAPLTKNQTKAFPEIESSGATVRGNNGGESFPAGTIIPPTKVDIIRPKDL